MKLAEVQALMWRAITWPTGVEDFLRRADPETVAAFEAAFGGTERFSRIERMGVYAEGYFFRLADVLTDQFGLTAWLCGEAPFHDLLTDYVLRCPPGEPDIRRVGAGLPGFLAGHELGAASPGLAEVAAIEWAVLEAALGPDEAPLRRESLAAIPLARWPDLRLQAATGVRLLPCRLPYPDLWSRWSAGDPVPDPVRELPCAVLLWRENLDVHHRGLDPSEARAFGAMLAGETFDAICEAAASGDRHDADAATVAAWLRRWVDDGLIATVG